MTTIPKPAPDQARLVLNAVSTVLGRGEHLEVYATEHGYLAGLPMTQALEVLEAVGLDPWAAPDRLGRGVQRLLRDVYKAPATTTDTVPDTKAAASEPAPTTTQEQPCTSSSHPKRSTRSASSSEPSPSTTPARSRAGSTKTPTHGSATSRPAGQDHSPSPLEPPSKSSRTDATASAKDATRAPSSPSASPTPSQQTSATESGVAAPEPNAGPSSPHAGQDAPARTDDTAGLTAAVLTAARTARGWSQRELAAAMVDAGHSSWRQITVSRVERAQRQLKPSEAETLAGLLDPDAQTPVITPSPAADPGTDVPDTAHPPTASPAEEPAIDTPDPHPVSWQPGTASSTILHPARDEVHDLTTDQLLDEAADIVAEPAASPALADALSTARRALVEIEWHLANHAERRALLDELRQISDRATAVEQRLTFLDAPPQPVTPAIA